MIYKVRMIIFGVKKRAQYYYYRCDSNGNHNLERLNDLVKEIH